MTRKYKELNETEQTRLKIAFFEWARHSNEYMRTVNNGYKDSFVAIFDKTCNGFVGIGCTCIDALSDAVKKKLYHTYSMHELLELLNIDFEFVYFEVEKVYTLS